jgi:hypothetical protein
LIQTCKDRSQGWWMRLKIYDPEGFLVSDDFWVAIGWKQKSRWIHDSNAQSPHGRRRGENGTDYFRPTDRPKAYGRQKRIQSDSCRIRSRIRLVFNGYRKGYGFTNIRPYPKIYHISRLYPDNIRQNIRQWVVEYMTEVKR